ncbi:SMI1/KNR4 family protein [Streptomyces armeniacus]|uniref:SMI1/KNR4 family protein n=1 Tax=Streptomyces armeniacus TaxID=83291 RepID=A0A345Y091_9ACTN|nr:SMI1/KNR4 family protein [Streptomyces armeniacus]
MAESWERAESWLVHHAPATYAALAPPADRAAIAEAERAVGLPFPDPLVESLLRHDGTDHLTLLPPFWSLLSAEGIADHWRLRSRIHGKGAEAAEPEAESELDESEHGPWWHRLWIPFAADGCGDYLVLDQRPTACRGRIGDADHEQGAFFESHAMWASLPALFEASVTAMETGEVLDSYERTVTEEGELDWEIL